MSETPGQRSASAVIDLIDGALGGDTSPDAMCWTSSPTATVAFTADLPDWVRRLSDRNSPPPIARLYLNRIT